MKKSFLIKELKKNGWWLLRQGANHEVWTNGDKKTMLGRHREIAEGTAQKILKTVRNYPGK